MPGMVWLRVNPGNKQSQLQHTHTSLYLIHPSHLASHTHPIYTNPITSHSLITSNLSPTTHLQYAYMPPSPTLSRTSPPLHMPPSFTPNHHTHPSFKLIHISTPHPPHTPSLHPSPSALCAKSCTVLSTTVVVFRK